MNPPRKTSPIDLDRLKSATAGLRAGDATETREERIYRLRVAGYSLKEIERSVGCTADEIDTAVASLAEVSRARLLSEMPIAVVIEVDRYDAMLKAIWNDCLAGDLAAQDRAMRIIQERRKMLGLDAPETRVTLSAHVDASQVDLKALSLDEVRSLTEIQGKLDRAKKAKRLPAKGPVIDVPES